MEIRRATAADLDAIARIQTAAPAASAWAPAAYLDYECRVAILDNRVAGFLVFRRLTPDEHEVLNLAVDPDYRRRGIARALLAGALADAPGAWFLEVRESNAAAVRLYSQFGFTLAGRRADYYRDPAEAAIVMRFFS